jgi:negative regulator of sigma E activity
MPKELHQKISQFLDDELDFHDSLKLLHAVRTQSELHHKLRRYEAVRHALKSGVFLPAHSDFAEQVREKIREHSNNPLPNKHLPIERVNKQSTWLSHPFAWAASLAMITLVTPYTVTSLNKSKQATQLELAKQQQQAELAKQQQIELAKQQPLNTQISQYLQTHNQVTHSYPQAHANMAVYTQK